MISDTTAIIDSTAVSISSDTTHSFYLMNPNIRCVLSEPCIEEIIFHLGDLTTIFPLQHLPNLQSLPTNFIIGIYIEEPLVSLAIDSFVSYQRSLRPLYLMQFIEKMYA